MSRGSDAQRFRAAHLSRGGSKLGILRSLLLSLRAEGTSGSSIGMSALRRRTGASFVAEPASASSSGPVLTRAAGRAGALTATFAFVIAVAVLLVPAAAAQADHNGDGVAHPPGDPTRSYELVSPAYKVAGVGAGVPIQGGGGPEQAGGAGSGAHVGERFSVSGQLGALLLDAPFATATDWALAERADSQMGWLSHSPVTHPFKASENYRMLQMQVAAPNLSTMMWAGNAGDLPFFEEMGSLGVSGDGSSLISDWGDPPQRPVRWEPIGPLEASQRINIFETYVFPVPSVSEDGTHLAVSGGVRGLAGAGGGCARDESSGAWLEIGTGLPCPDPTVDTIPANADSAYVDDISAGLSDSWPGAGIRTPMAVCTGQDDGPGLARTRIPVRNSDGSLGEAACALKDAARDARLVSDYGSAITLSGTVGTSTTNVISEDGSRSFFMAPDPTLGTSDNPGASACVDADALTKCPSQLYVRQRNSDGEVVTRWISRPEAGLLDNPLPAALLGAAFFEGASVDGSRVFFRTDSPLTADDPNGRFQTPANANHETVRGARSWDLYMFELAPGPDGDRSTPDGDPTGPGSRLTRITAGPSGTADCSTQPGSAPAAALRFSSDDGRRVFFSCAAPLGGVADRATGTAAGVQAGTPTTTNQTNVYLYDANEADPAQRYTFVARVPFTTFSSSSNNQNLTRCASAAGLRGTSLLIRPSAFTSSAVSCWRGSGDGTLATFWTLGRLTSDDPHEFGVGSSADIYAYDADSDELVRVSAPQGAVDETYTCGHSSTRCYGDPGMHSIVSGQVAPNPLLNVASGPGGRVVFFESASRLVDGDQNSVFDVYQWRDGVLSLVSSGAPGSDGTTYKGNSADGRNVYLATRDRLTWQDADAVLDIYTARVGGGIARPVPPTACLVLADGCQGGGAASAPSSPASEGPAAGGDARPGVRRRVALLRPSVRTRRRAARTGVLALRVRASRPGVVRLGARATIGRKSIKVAGARKRLAKAGTATMKLRLNRRARRVLGQGRVLRVTLRVAQRGARSRTATVGLKRGNR
jgi:hypothetical protein